jgi:hypothetical protein
MNAYLKLTALISILISSPTWAGNGYGQNQDAGNQHTPNSVNSSSCPTVNVTEPLSAEAISSLNFMREEEKLARDVYQVLANQWQVKVFENIVSSEQTHMDQIKCLLDSYQLADSASTVAGQFNNSELQNLYQTLTARGQTSLVEALRVGALIEEVDIRDLNQGLTLIQVPEIRTVYQSLLEGSKNHLRAFTNNLAQQGETYQSQVLGDAEVAALVGNSGTPIFDMESSRLVIPEMRLRQNNSISLETYQVELQLNPDGKTLQIIQVQQKQ